MNLQPNLNGALRFFYVLAGFGLILWGFLGASPGFGQIVWPIAGAVILIEGLVAYCPLMALFGLGNKKS